LHGKPSELASKLVRDLSKEIEGAVKLSTQNRKPLSGQKDAIVIPKIFENNYLRKIVQGVMLPFYLLFLRLKYDTIFSFWVADKKYHCFLFNFLKFLRYEIIFTIISSCDKDYSCLKFCDVIICQSERMGKALNKIFPGKEIKIIPPWADLKLFKPGKKENSLLIPSVPYKVEDFEERGINKMINVLKKNRIKTKIIFRSQESHRYFKKLDLKNVKLINKVLDDAELAKIMAGSKVIPLFYLANTPDVPLSAVEGLACGCSIICTDGMGLAEIIKKEKCGIVIQSRKNTEKEIIQAINKLLKNQSPNKRARTTAEKYFDKKKNIKEYVKLIEE